MDQKAGETGEVSLKVVVTDNNVETETKTDVETTTGTVFMANGEKKVVNFADFEASLAPEYGIVLMPNGERWVVNIAKWNAAKGISPRRSGVILGPSG